MLAEINVSSKQRLWAEAVATSVYLRNRLPTRMAKTRQIPYQLWHGELPSIEHLHPFGCLAYANKTKEQIALGKKDEIGTKYSSQIFFFQAEDGIRDLTVTGVQTCALPI